MEVGLSDLDGFLNKKNAIDTGLIQGRYDLECSLVSFRSLWKIMGWSWLPYKLSEVSFATAGE